MYILDSSCIFYNHWSFLKYLEADEKYKKKKIKKCKKL